MKILFESKQLNEGPGAGYTVSGTLTNVKVNAIKNIKEVDRTDLVEYEVEIDATATFEDVSANSYYYGGTIESTPVSIERVRVEFSEEDLSFESDEVKAGEPSKEDIRDAISGAKIEATLGGGWSHSTFDGIIDVDYNGINDSYSLLGITFELTDKRAVEYLDKAVQNENTETQYGVVENHWVEAAFDTVEDAIQFAKENGYETVQELYVLIDINGDEIDTEFGDIVWTNDDIEESLKEDKKLGKDAKKALNRVISVSKDLFSDENLEYATVEEIDGLIQQLTKLRKSVEERKDYTNESHTKPLTESFDDEDRINALAAYLNIDPSEISNIYDYEFETPDGDYLVVDEDEAEALAKEDIENLFDDLGLDSFTSDFKDWIIMNALDNEWFEDAIRESYEYYVEDIEDEASSMGYENRLIEELHDHQVLSDDDFEEGEDGEPDLATLKDDVDIDDKKEEFIDLLVENAGNPVDYCGDEFGWDWVTQMATSNNLIDMNEVIDQCIYMDGIAHFIARYDGQEHELGNGLYAYRTN